MAYIDERYSDSVCCRSVMGCSAEQLRNRRPYTVGAIAFHRREGNAGQVAFFTAELALIDRRLRLLEGRLRRAEPPQSRARE